MTPWWLTFMNSQKNTEHLLWLGIRGMAKHYRNGSQKCSACWKMMMMIDVFWSFVLQQHSSYLWLRWACWTFLCNPSKRHSCPAKQVIFGMLRLVPLIKRTWIFLKAAVKGYFLLDCPIPCHSACQGLPKWLGTLYLNSPLALARHSFLEKFYLFVLR